MGSVLELAAEGNTEAMVRLAELSRVAKGDLEAEQELSDALTEVVRTAPEEWVVALKAAQAPDRDAALVLLARGLVRAGDADHPLWPALKKMMGALDTELASFARKAEGQLATRIAEEKAPTIAPGVPVIVPSTGAMGSSPTGIAETRPGG
jgi:D-alanyl-D-alanine carboxypeptidase/D-alanyl-D-alanine-endopeptidase (penicillin-binding protein 4)